MHVLIVSHLFPNTVDPRLGIFVLEQIKELHRYCKCTVISPSPWFPPLKVSRWYDHRQNLKEETMQQIKVYRPRRIVFPRGYGQLVMAFFYFISLYGIAKKMRWQIDLIHAHCVWPDGFAAVLLGKLWQLPVIVTSHGADTHRFLKNKLTKPFIAYSLHQADTVIAVAKTDKSIIQKYCSHLNNIKLIHNGVDIKKFFPRDQMAVRKELGLPIEKKIILYVGYLYPVKGVEYLLLALGKIVDSIPSIYLVIVGGGRQQQKIKQTIKHNNLHNHVRLVGEKRHDEIPLWMNAGDILCLPSLNEGWPTVIFESLACGKPVVATRVGGIPEIIRNENDGLLVPPKNEDALADSLLNALTKSWNRNDLISYAGNHSWRQKAKELVEHVYSHTIKMDIPS